MPAEVISMVHQMVSACKKYMGIVFTNKDGNVIDGSNDMEEKLFEISGVEDHSLQNTEQNALETAGVTGVENNTADVTGMESKEEMDVSHNNGENTGVSGNYNIS